MRHIQKAAELYSAGTKLAEVAPDVAGLPLTWRGWIALERRRMWRETADYGAMLDPDQSWISQQRISGARDNYGIKGV